MTIIAIKDKCWQTKDQYTKTMLLNIRSIYKKTTACLHTSKNIVRRPNLKIYHSHNEDPMQPSQKN